MIAAATGGAMGISEGRQRREEGDDEERRHVERGHVEPEGHVLRAFELHGVTRGKLLRVGDRAPLDRAEREPAEQEPWRHDDGPERAAPGDLLSLEGLDAA